MSAGVAAAWDEPTGGTPRGTLVVLPGRGETAEVYQRFGRRVSADAWRVRLVDVDLDDPGATRDVVEKVLVDETLPGPKVLVGADAGATLAAVWAGDLPLDAVVLAGLALAGSATAAGGTWEEEVGVRTACPVHTRVLGEDAGFVRGALSEPLPAGLADGLDALELDVPALVLHGSDDAVTPATAVLALLERSPSVRVALVEGGRHDVLNDASHRSVAATLVLFLESLRLGADLPDVVRSGR